MSKIVSQLSFSGMEINAKNNTYLLNDKSPNSAMFYDGNLNTNLHSDESYLYLSYSTFSSTKKGSCTWAEY